MAVDPNNPFPLQYQLLSPEIDPITGMYHYQYGDSIFSSSNPNRAEGDLTDFENDVDITDSFLGKGLFREGAGRTPVTPVTPTAIKRPVTPGGSATPVVTGEITSPIGAFGDVVDKALGGSPPVKAANTSNRTFSGSTPNQPQTTQTQQQPGTLSLLNNPFARRAARGFKKIGEKEQERFDAQASGMLQLQLAQERREVRRKELERNYNEKQEQYDLMAEYGNMPYDEIVRDRATAADPNAPLAERAAAKRRLERAREVDSGRAFGSVFSKILAAVSVGMGAYGAKNTGRNFALEIFNKTIADDVAAQKDMFNRKGLKAKEVRNSYAHFMREFDNEAAAEDAAITATTNRALLGLSGEVAKMQKGVEADKMMDIWTTKKNQNIAAQNKLAREWAEKESINEARKITPIPGLRRASPELQQQGIEIEKGWIKLDSAITEIEAAAGNIERVFSKYKAKTFADVVTQIDNLVSGKSLNPERASALKTELSGYYEALVNGIRKAKEMGVLQKFERKELDNTVDKPTAFDALMKTKFDTPLGSVTFARAFVLPIKQTLSDTMVSMSSGSTPFYVFDKGRDPKTGAYRFKYDPAAMKEEAEALSAGLRPGVKGPN
tara:strand:- start:4719 stop:6545 length:1827 start_codon:yes stop_codon:yes gene_type:complete